MPRTCYTGQSDSVEGRNVDNWGAKLGQKETTYTHHLMHGMLQYGTVFACLPNYFVNQFKCFYISYDK